MTLPSLTLLALALQPRLTANDPPLERLAVIVLPVHLQPTEPGSPPLTELDRARVYTAAQRAIEARPDAAITPLDAEALAALLDLPARRDHAPTLIALLPTYTDQVLDIRLSRRQGGDAVTLILWSLPSQQRVSEVRYIDGSADDVAIHEAIDRLVVRARGDAPW